MFEEETYLLGTTKEGEGVMSDEIKDLEKELKELKEDREKKEKVAKLKAEIRKEKQKKSKTRKVLSNIVDNLGEMDFGI